MKIQLYSAKPSADVPDQPRLADLDVVGAPYRAAAHAASAAGHEALAWGQQAGEMKRREDEAKGEVEAIKLQTEYERALVNRDIELRGEDDYDYNVHDQKLDEAGQTLLEEFAGKAKSPIAAKKFRVAAMRGLKEKVINAKYEAKLRLDGEQDAANYDQNQRVAVAAANTPDVRFREVKIAEQERLNQEAANRGQIKPEEAGKRSRQLREDVDTILARRAMREDPSQFLLDLEELDEETGEMRWKNLTATRREQLTEQAVKLADKKSKDTDRINREHSGALKKHLTDRMDSGVDAATEIRALRDALTDEDYTHLLERNKKIHEDGPRKSDFETYTRLEARIRFEGLTDYRVVDDHKGKLAKEDYSHLVGLIDRNKEKGRDERKSDDQRTRDRLIDAGKTAVSSMFKVTGVFNFDQASEQIGGMAMAEYVSRAAREKDIDPGALANEVIAKFAPALLAKLKTDSGDISAIVKYKTEDEIKAAYREGKLTADEALSASRVLQRYNLLLEAEGGRPAAAAAPAKTAPKPAAAPAKRRGPLPGALGGG